MQNFDKYLESLDEGKIVLKRKYTENYPEKNVRQKASIRNTIIEALRDKKLTLSEFNEIVAQHSKSPSKWTKRNARFFNIKEDNVTLSGYGTKIANTIQPVNEKNHDKKSVLKALGKNDDATILYRGQEYIIYNPDNGNDENTDMWGDKTVFALDQDGDEIEVAYKDIERIDASHQINLDEAKAPKNWDSMFTMKAIEAYKNGEFDLEDDKSIAEWDKEYNGGRAPKPAFNTKEVVSYAIKTGKKPNGDKMDESVVTEGFVSHYAPGDEFERKEIKSIKLIDKKKEMYTITFVDGETQNVQATRGMKFSEKGMFESAKLEDTVRHLSDKQYNELAKEYKINPDSRKDMEDFVRGCSDKDAKKIIKKYSQIKEMVYTTFTDFVNESYMVESLEINEKLKSSKLRGLLSMEKSPKSLLKGIYGQTKIALDKVEDHQIVDVDPKDGPKQDGYVFYYTTQEKENPYAPGQHYNLSFPANSLLALAKGKRVFYVQSRWNRKGGHEYSLTTKSDGGRMSSSTSIGPNKSYSGWDASGLGSLARVIAIADAAFVVNPEALETTGELLMQRSQAKEGAIAFKDDKEFKNANMARYKEILTKRSSTLDVDKEIVKAIEEVADIMKSGIKNKKKDKYNQIIMGTGKNGRTFRINDLTNFTNNLMSDYERWAQYTNDAENAKARLEKEGADTREEQWEVKYNEREALKYAKDIKDRLKKLKSKNLAW